MEMLERVTFAFEFFLFLFLEIFEWVRSGTDFNISLNKREMAVLSVWHTFSNEAIQSALYDQNKRKQPKETLVAGKAEKRTIVVKWDY